VGIPERWRLHRSRIGWAVFAFLSSPALFFAIITGISDGFTPARILAAVIFLSVIALISRLLWYGLLKSSIVLIAVVMIFVVVILVAYAGAISVLVGGWKIDIF